MSYQVKRAFKFSSVKWKNHTYPTVFKWSLKKIYKNTSLQKIFIYELLLLILLTWPAFIVILYLFCLNHLFNLLGEYDEQ